MEFSSQNSHDVFSDFRLTSPNFQTNRLVFPFSCWPVFEFFGTLRIFLQFFRKIPLVANGLTSKWSSGSNRTRYLHHGFECTLQKIRRTWRFFQKVHRNFRKHGQKIDTSRVWAEAQCIGYGTRFFMSFRSKIQWENKNNDEGNEKIINRFVQDLWISEWRVHRILHRTVSKSGHMRRTKNWNRKTCSTQLDEKKHVDSEENDEGKISYNH